MSDLRSRIAAVLHRELSPPCCDECHDWGPEPWEIELADAVIRELQLTVLGDGIVVGVMHA